MGGTRALGVLSRSALPLLVTWELKLITLPVREQGLEVESEQNTPVYEVVLFAFIGAEIAGTYILESRA